MLVSNGHRLPLIGTQWECGPWNWRILFSFIIAMACHLSDYARIMPTLPTSHFSIGNAQFHLAVLQRQIYGLRMVSPLPGVPDRGNG
jgi:hypothetical protein